MALRIVTSANKRREPCGCSRHRGHRGGARRELAEEAGLDVDVAHLEQLGVYGDPGRDPRGRVVSVAHLAIVPRLPDPVPGTDVEGACWTPVDRVLFGHVVLTFDHARITADGVERARVTLEHTSLATAFCGQAFTLTELQQVNEAAWGDPARTMP